MLSSDSEPKNCPAWLVPEHEAVLQFKQPLFVRPLLIDVTKHDARVSQQAGGGGGGKTNRCS